LSVYFDSSALVKRYVREPESELAKSFLESVTDPITSAVTIIEVRRVIGRYVSAIEGITAGALFKRDLSSMAIVDLTAEIVENAAEIASKTHLRTLDSIHLASAMAASCTQIVTFDRMQARVAQSLGISPVILE
jgi:hypothetical protein